MSSSSSEPIHRLFSAQVARTPDAIALDGAEGLVTYQELAERSRRVAHLLMKHGVAPGDVVAVAMNRGINAVAGFLAILSAGACYCPLDLNQPSERIEFLLNDAKPTAILASREIADRLPPTSSAVWVENADHFSHLASDSVDRIHPRGVACLLYTSGSTGIPKGVLIPHLGIIRLVIESDFIPFGSTLRMLFHSQVVFDASTLEIFGPLLNGGTCVLFGGRGVPTLHELREAIRRFRVNTLYLGPAPYNLIIEESPEVLEGLDWLILGGEAMSPTHARKGLEIFPHLHLVNGYGPTETTTFATAYQVPRDLPVDAKSVPIGKPIARTEAYIFDSGGALITDGTPGELLVGGAGVACGYLNRPELTTERFVPNPFSTDPEARLYRTGDFCRWLGDGNLDFIGRMDHQVKIRGHRVEPGEIEAAMRQHPAIGQCIVIARGDSADKYLAGFYTLARHQLCSVAELRRHLQDRLPAYLVPEKLIALETMPATRNGKVDRRALPDDNIGITTDSPQGRPSSPLEKELAELWKQSLRMTEINIDDCFFELGGSSLGMMRLCAQIQRKTNRFISVAAFLSASTVAKMAAVLNQPERMDANSLAILLKPGHGEPMFCIPGHGGHPLFFRPMAQQLRWPGPIYGLQFPGLDAATSPAHCVEEIAEEFIAEIDRLLSSTQRCHLLGYSFGGVIAFEMARQLQTCGGEVGALILLDAFTAAAVQSRPRLERLGIHLKNFFRQGPRKEIQRIYHRRQHIRQDADSSDPPLMPRVEQVNELNRRAFEKYVPRMYRGDVYLVQPAEHPEWLEFFVVDPSGGWSEVVGGQFQIKPCAGDHLTMFDEAHMAELAEIVFQCSRLNIAEPA